MFTKKTDIGLVTWHFHTNVGSNLQAYALYKTISDLGYSCEFVNYRGNHRGNFIRGFIKEILIKIYSVAPFLFPKKWEEKVFVFQKTFMKETRKYFDKHQLNKCNKQFSMFICGSDQIWAPNVFDDVYMLSFADDDKPKCSYAASVGLNYIPEEKKEVYRKYLERFEVITVRERQGKELLENIICKEVTTVLDPTFLVKKEDWEEIALLPNEKKYLFCYLLGNDSEYCEWIEGIAKENGLKVICVTNTTQRKYDHWTYYSYVGPRTFLGYIKSSELVVTDSFHGMALSLNLQKDFYILERFKIDDGINQNSRIYNILEQLNIYDRLMLEPIKKIEHIDYLKISPQILSKRNDSIHELKRMLKILRG